MKKLIAVVGAILLFGFAINAAIDAKKEENRFLLKGNAPVRVLVETGGQEDGLAPVRTSTTAKAAKKDTRAISDDRYEDNDTLATAKALAAGTYTGLVLLDEDYFKVYVEAGKDLKVSVSGAAFSPTEGSDMDIVLYNASGSILVAALSDSTNETLCLSNLSAGWYIIRNFWMGVAYGYTLTIASGNLSLGEISGRVTDIRGSGIAHIWVTLYEPGGAWSLVRGYVPTDSSGNYRFAYTGGDHRVLFDSNSYSNRDLVGSYVNEWYNDVATIDAAQILTIQVGQTLAGIDAVLADAGMVSGLVTGPDGQPLGWAVAQAFDDSGNFYSGTRTFNDGTYWLRGIPASGNYHIRFRPNEYTGYAMEWYNNKSWSGAADAVPVVIRQETPGINAQLEDGGTISGQVTDASSGQPIANVTVHARDEADMGIYNGVTGSDGQYSINWLPTCGVKLFFTTGTTAYTSQWYSNKYSFASANIVSATAGLSVTGIDVQLHAPAIISGTILLGESPLADVVMNGLPGNPATDSSGFYTATVDYNWSGTVTPALGDFTFTPANRVYTNVAADQTSQDYTAAEASTEPNDDSASAAALPLGTNADLIFSEGDVDWYKFFVPAEKAGLDLKVNVRVTSPYPDPIPEGWRSDLDFELLDGSLRVLGVTISGSDNETLYIHGVASGWYYIYIGYCSTVYADSSTYARYAVSLELDTAAVLGIGYISGRLVNGSGLGVANEFIFLNPLLPDDWSGSRPYMTSGLDGNFTIAFTPGTYTLLFTNAGKNLSGNYTYASPNVVPEYYNNKKVDADQISISSGGTLNLGDVALDTGAIVSGHVTDSSAADLANVSVRSYDLAGNTYQYEYVKTDASGDYTLNGIPAGGAKLYFGKNGYAGEFYNDKPSRGSADTLATAAGVTITGINAQLGIGGTISGSVTDGLGSGIGNVKVMLYSALDSTVNRTSIRSTGGSGSFSFSNVKPGDYKIYFDTAGLAFTPEWYADASSFAAATVVNVTEEGTTSGIDAHLAAVTISGTITLNGSPLVNVTMSGLPGNPATDASGIYSAAIGYNWSGTVTPTLSGVVFTPATTTYANVTTDQVTDYTAALTLTNGLVVTVPNSTSFWEKGKTYAITWVKQGVQNANVKIMLYKGTATLVKTIVATTPNDGSFDWLVPTALATGSTYFIKVKTIDNLISDDSDKFSIIIPTITVTAPTLGTVWVKNATKAITWAKQGTQDAYVKIQLYKGTVKKLDITLSASNSGSYDWPIPSALINGLYTVRVTTLDNKVIGKSAAFSIASGLIQVTQPVAGNKLIRGTAKVINWYSEGAVNANVKIHLYRGTNKVQDISLGTPTAGGTFSWDIPANLALATTYSIRVTAVDNLVTGKSGTFAIIAGIITVTQPTAGAIWQRGVGHTITWTKEGPLLNSNVKIQLVKGTTVVSTLTTTTANDGSFDWTIAAGQALAANYKIRIITVDNLVKADSSVFTISNTAGLTLLAPNGAMILKAVETQAIRWSDDPDVLEVKLEFSRDNGGTFTTIADHVVDTGSYDWKVPVNFTRNAIVRVSDSNGKLWREDGLLEFSFKFNYGGAEAEPGAVFWFGSRDPKSPSYGFARIEIGSANVQFGGFNRVIEPLAGDWHELRVRFNFRRDTAEIRLDDRMLFENAALYTTPEHFFQPCLVLQTGGEAPLAFTMDDLAINIVQLDSAGEDRQMFNALTDNFDRYDEKANALQNCWQWPKINDRENKVELNAEDPLNKSLRLQSEADKQLMIYLPFALPDRIPFDISDQCLVIENR